VRDTGGGGVHGAFAHGGSGRQGGWRGKGYQVDAVGHGRGQLSVLLRGGIRGLGEEDRGAQTVVGDEPVRKLGERDEVAHARAREEQHVRPSARRRQFPVTSHGAACDVSGVSGSVGSRLECLDRSCLGSVGYFDLG
jgi:hypothetical protein